MATASELRRRTIRWARGAKFPVVELPRTVVGEPVRDANDVARRILCLYATAATAYGCRRHLATAWLDDAGASQALTANERRYLSRWHLTRSFANGCIQAIWALTWAGGISSGFRMSAADAPENLIEEMPSMLVPSSAESFIASVALRSTPELQQELDRSRYMHWLHQAPNLEWEGDPEPCESYVAWRRRAFEWLFTEGDFDGVELSGARPNS